MATRRAGITFIILALLSLTMGSVHAFSVLVIPLTERFGASTASVSAIYSLALVSITAMVTLGHHFYARVSAAVLIAVLTTIAIGGILLAARAESIVLVWLGFGVLFGAANGGIYGYTLQLSAQISPRHEGLAMGAITAAYAMGAVVFSKVFENGPGGGGFVEAMHALAAALFAYGSVAVVALAYTGARFKPKDYATGGSPVTPGKEIAVFWLAYGTAVLAGLMTIGHAVGIADVQGLSATMLEAAPMVIAICNMAGSLAGGWLTDRIPARWLLMGLPLVSAFALALLALKIEPSILAMLGIIGLVYGAVISVYPAVIARRFGVAAGVPIYGKVFTAWAVAGICGPVLAGALFDTTGSFQAALAIAAVLGVASSVIAWRIPV